MGKFTYEVITIEMLQKTLTNIKQTFPDGRVVMIPEDESNADYQAYLRWLENSDATYDQQQAMNDAHVATE